MSDRSLNQADKIANWLVFSDQAQPVRQMVEKDRAVYVARFGHAPSNGWLAERVQAAVRICVDRGLLHVDE